MDAYLRDLSERYPSLDANGRIRPMPTPVNPGGLSALLRAGGETRYNIPNANVGDGNQGYVVDLNGNGQYNRGQDAIIGLDFDGDGNLSQEEMSRSRGMFSNWGESQYDRDHDGRISNQELNEAGGRAWVDRNGDGRIGEGEVSTVNDFRTNNGARPQERHRINEIDPSRRRSDVSTDRLQSWEDDDPLTKGLPKSEHPLPWDQPKMWCPGPNDPILRKPNEETPWSKLLGEPKPNEDGVTPSNPLGKPKDHFPGVNDPILRGPKQPTDPWAERNLDPGFSYQPPKNSLDPWAKRDLDPGFSHNPPQPRGGRPQPAPDITYGEPARPRNDTRRPAPKSASPPSKPRSNATSRTRSAK